MKAKKAYKGIFRDRRTSKIYMVRRDSGIFPKYRALELNQNAENEYKYLCSLTFWLFYESVGSTGKFALPLGRSTKKKRKNVKIYKPQD